MTDQTRDEELDQIQFQIVSEHEATGHVDAQSWLGRYPQYAAELSGFILAVLATPRSEDAPESGPDELTAMRRAVNRVLDEQGLSSPEERERTLGIRLAAARSSAEATALPLQQREFRKALVFARGVNVVRETAGEVGPLVAQKVSYLLELAMRPMLFLEHVAYTYGPFDKTLLPKAKEEGLIEIRSKDSLVPGPELERAEQYLPKYLSDPDLATEFIQALARLDPFELETLGTVAMAAQELSTLGSSITVPSVTAQIALSKEERLGSSNFRPDQIQAALDRLERLGLLPPGT